MATLAVPPMLPPESVVADTTGNTIYIIIEAILVAISCALVLARLYVRSFILKSLGLDELFIVIALIIAISAFVITAIMTNERIESVKNGPPLYVPEILVALKYQETSQPLTILSITFTRISISFFLLRIFWADRAWRLGLYFIMIFAAVTGIATAAITVTQCQPVQKLWYPFMPGKCWSLDTIVSIGDFQGAVAVVCDWVLATLPIVFMWNVQMSRKAKAGICVLMSLGYFTGVCTIVKTVLLKNIVLNKGDGSVTWGLVDLAIWVVLEENIGIIAACIPTLRPLFNKAIRDGRKSRSSGSRSLGRSSNNRYIRKTSGDSASRQLDDKPGLHHVELNNVNPPVPSARSYSFDKRGIAIASAFPEDEASFENKSRKTEPPLKSVDDGGFYEHEEEAFDRL